jgi:hypothetical protein
LNKARTSYIKNCITNNNVTEVTVEDLDFMVKDTKSDESFVMGVLKEMGVKIKQ